MFSFQQAQKAYHKRNYIQEYQINVYNYLPVNKIMLKLGFAYIKGQIVYYHGKRNYEETSLPYAKQPF